MNACSFCKNGKRKCNKARPSCSNCLRLAKDCIYTEDTVQTHFRANPLSTQTQSQFLKLGIIDSLPRIDPFNHGALQQSIIDIAMQILGSLDNVVTVSNEFFIGTHQRIPAVSKFRFYKSLQACTTKPSAEFAMLCLSILLMQQMPSGKMTNMQSPLYVTVKNLISLLEAANNLSLDLVHCRVLVAFYEMGHGLHAASYMSIAACARTARVLGLHRKRWRNISPDSDKLSLEEEKRTWLAIVNMDRFISLCNGDALFVTNDSERTDPLPIEDLIWSEGSILADIERLITTPPSFDTPFNVTVGQMARESQISHLAGRVVRNVFDPMPDPEFNKEEAIQLENTLKAYLPLLADEELRIGKYCGAFGMCNSALFILYEFMLNHNTENPTERNRILESIEDTSLRAFTFGYAAYGDREENYPADIQSPYLPYSLCQAAIIQYRLWKQNSDEACKRRVDLLKSILGEFTKRWAVAWQYLDIIEKLNDSWSSVAVPFQGHFISTGDQRLHS